jgi:gas vesicle protein
MIANNSDIDTSYFDARARGRGGAGGYIATAVVAAAVGAGVALLFAPEKGVTTRKRLNRRLSELELRDRLGDRLSDLQDYAEEGVDYVQRRVTGRKRSRSRLNPQLLGIAGTVLGAALTAMLAPEGSRERVRSTVDDLRSSAGDRLERLRRNRRRAARASFDESFEGDGRERSNSPVRNVEETAQDPTKVF